MRAADRQTLTARTLSGSHPGPPPRSASAVVKRSIVIAGHQTSVSLEDAFWSALKTIAGRRTMTVAALVAAIDGSRDDANLSSAIRVFVLATYEAAALAAEPPTDQ